MGRFKLSRSNFHSRPIHLRKMIFPRRSFFFSFFFLSLLLFANFPSFVFFPSPERTVSLPYFSDIGRKSFTGIHGGGEREGGECGKLAVDAHSWRPGITKHPSYFSVSPVFSYFLGFNFVLFFPSSRTTFLRSESKYRARTIKNADGSPASHWEGEGEGVGEGGWPGMDGGNLSVRGGRHCHRSDHALRIFFFVTRNPTGENRYVDWELTSFIRRERD